MAHKECWALKNKQGQFKRSNGWYKLDGIEIVTFKSQTMAKNYIKMYDIDDNVWKAVKVRITIKEKTK